MAAPISRDLEAHVRWRLTLSLFAASAAVLGGSLPATATAAASGSAAAAARSGGTASSATASVGQPLYAFNTGLVLTVSAKPGRGAAVRVAADTGSGGQRWVAGRNQTLRPAADQSLCLNVPDGRYRSGAKLQLWACDGHGSERFATSAASAHTQVLFIRPAARASYCLTALSAPPDETRARIGLRACASLTTQAWSRANLDGVAGTLSDAWAIQALHPTRAGSAVTADGRPFANQLDEFWIATYTGSAGASPALLKPVDDTVLCAGLSAPEAAGAAVSLAQCTGSASQQFTGIAMIGNASYTWSYLTTADTSFCLQAAASGGAAERPVVLGACQGTNRDLWQTDLDLTTGISDQFQEVYAGPGTGPAGLEYSIAVAGKGGAGSGIVLSRDVQAAAQVWTDLAPGQSKAAGNSDGSVTLRPLSDESLCLTVPGGSYTAGVQLTVQTCNGQTDQEFVRSQQYGAIGLVAAGAGGFCVAAPAGIAAGSAVELEPCAQQDDQLWSTFLSWYGWAGLPPTGTAPTADLGDALILSGASASGGEVGVGPSLGAPAWNAAEDWVAVESGSGFEIQSFDDRSLCLDAPADTAGTQLTAAPCTGGPAQTFLDGATPSAGSLLWALDATIRTTKLCVAVGPVSGGAGLPLVLQTCSASQPDEGWAGPMSEL
jgi:Ricin-type beta-trefoil lectin domain